MERVRWFSCATALKMWYWNETKKVWRTGYRLFHGKFLTVSPGPRYTGLTVSEETKRVSLTPDLSEKLISLFHAEQRCYETPDQRFPQSSMLE